MEKGELDLAIKAAHAKFVARCSHSLFLPMEGTAVVAEDIHLAKPMLPKVWLVLSCIGDDVNMWGCWSLGLLFCLLLTTCLLSILTTHSYLRRWCLCSFYLTTCLLACLIKILHRYTKRRWVDLSCLKSCSCCCFCCLSLTTCLLAC